MMFRCRAEVPKNRVALARKQQATGALVTGPFTNVRARDVADVVLVEQEYRTEGGVAQRLARLLEALGPEPREVDPLLPIDSHRRPARSDVHGRASPFSCDRTTP